MGQALKCIDVKIVNEQTLKLFRRELASDGDETDIMKNGWKTLW